MNCKPQILFEGTHDTSIKEPFMTEDGFEDVEVDVTERYKIEIVPEWMDSEPSRRIDINRHERVRLPLFTVTTETVGPNTHTQIRFGSNLSKEEVEEKGQLFSNPVRVETPSRKPAMEPNVRYEHSLSKETFKEIDWNQKSITITSANAEKLDSELEIEWHDGEIPAVCRL
ncbi:hypothetical protein [Natronomonas sp. EA1]|uniref:hypothetical protein n=1 Tax=Natronomonas sp. EA1 TaxID=3421655 RepID=UPI003EBA75DF